MLNSHRRFFLSYAAPVLWNLTIIGTLIAFGRSAARLSAWRSRRLGIGGRGVLSSSGSSCHPFCGSCGGLDTDAAATSDAVRTVIRNFVPVFIGRGVVQISAYVDTVLASLLPTGAVAALSYAQVLYTLPVSLFGMSVSAAELPAMSRDRGRERAGRSAANSAGSRASPDRLLRGALGDGLPGPGRRHRRGTVSDRGSLPGA